MVLLPKPDGGHRPIGLLPTVIRVWMRARAEHAIDWEARNNDDGIYGGKERSGRLGRKPSEPKRRRLKVRTMAKRCLT